MMMQQRYKTRYAQRHFKSGFTLLELLIVLSMTVVISGAIFFAYSAAVSAQRLHEQSLTTHDQTATMERQITELIEDAQLSGSVSDTSSYFIASNDAGGGTVGVDRITFSTTAGAVPVQSIYSTDDFETQQTEYGPVGGMAEVSLGTNPVGSAGNHVGLFLRTQRPGDADATQGGEETDIDSDVTTMGFEFWDGTEWVSAWDTTTGTRRLPQAVQVTYTLKGDTSNTPHMFVVPIFSSDVTALKPYTSATT